ncbi:unnamed protein product, partial [Rotaria sordida]
NGWLKHLGTLDFAGGTVVHILSGVSGFVASLILGKRSDYDPRSTTGHNLPFTILGTCLLWVGWSGFNAGSANGADGIAALALVNTNAAAATGLVTWVVIDAIRGHVSISGACIGPIVGLVAVTPACGFVQPGWAVLIGFIATVVVYFLLLNKHHMHFDDTLDVALVHGCGGVLGAFMTGLFPQKSINPVNGNDGAFYGRPIQLWYQIAGILTAIGFAAACTAGILIILDWIMGIRLAEEDEVEGLDLTAHGENWEVTASQAIGDLVKTILEEQKHMEAAGQDTGTFELRYNPKNPKKMGFKIPLLKQKDPHNTRVDMDPGNNDRLQQDFYQTHPNDDEINIESMDTHILRF